MNVFTQFQCIAKSFGFGRRDYEHQVRAVQDAVGNYPSDISISVQSATYILMDFSSISSWDGNCTFWFVHVALQNMTRDVVTRFHKLLYWTLWAFLFLVWFCKYKQCKTRSQKATGIGRCPGKTRTIALHAWNPLPARCAHSSLLISALSAVMSTFIQCM